MWLMSGNEWLCITVRIYPLDSDHESRVFLMVFKVFQIIKRLIFLYIVILNDKPFEIYYH